jgi:hypothetical protein
LILPEFNNLNSLHKLQLVKDIQVELLKFDLILRQVISLDKQKLKFHLQDKDLVEAVLRQFKMLVALLLLVVDNALVALLLLEALLQLAKLLPDFQVLADQVQLRVLPQLLVNVPVELVVAVVVLLQ